MARDHDIQPYRPRLPRRPDDGAGRLRRARSGALRLPRPAAAPESVGEAAPSTADGPPTVAPPALRGGALRADEVRVRFGGLVAVDDVSLEVAEGRVTALVGPNGAGKTTFFNALMGAVRPEAGRIFLDETELTDLPSEVRARLGLARTFQNLQLVEDSSVIENLVVGGGPLMRSGIVSSVLGLPRARAQDRRLRGLARKAAALAGVPASEETAVGDLPQGIRRRLEVARALISRPRVVLLDEPAAGLDIGETQELGELITRIRDGLGASVFVVEHDMSLVRGFADHVYVLNFGRVIASGPPEEVLRDPEVVAAYLGGTSAQA